ncbi:hypothetical protein [Paenibacillus xerothermodurans]|uniref:Uncharacterized protein n=1 Tax=Paenibacillus xerothermodurans TaxID=1977292 RepID=A0A2W1N8Z0_PAEXE|nr:hypothetical protein [Paenibacillus xerothermodurans]PZE21099.1 hypothetical protein CBW46_010510 [Paenibacillus xerothermodurans]
MDWKICDVLKDLSERCGFHLLLAFKQGDCRGATTSSIDWLTCAKREARDSRTQTYGYAMFAVLRGPDARFFATRGDGQLIHVPASNADKKTN